MRGYFLQIQQYLEYKYPVLRGNIHSSTYPPSKFGQMVASITNIAWFGGIALLFGGTGLFKTFEMAEPQFYVAMKNNPVAAFAGLFVMNSMGASLLSTGAFEVYLDDTLIYSKLERGRMPTVDDIRAGLDAYGLKEA
jgi:selT/selW/selH-like putative selenoprotein